MPQPTPYDRITNFQNDQALAPTDPYPAQLVDAEYNAIKITTDEILQNLALIQRDDGQLANDSVGLDQLRDEVQIGFNAPSAWEAGHEYIVGDTVFHVNAFWACIVSHTSTTFEADHAAGYWSLIADFNAAVIIGAPMLVSDGPPVTPAPGSQWFESDTGNTYLWYVEPGETAGQWVHINGDAGGASGVLADLVAGLPVASIGMRGLRAVVTDATSTTFMAVAVGGGANTVPVFCDGTAWKIG